MKLHLDWELQRITTKFEFKIARSAESYYDVVILRLSDGTHTGFGEAAPSKRYEKGPEAVAHLVENLKTDLANLPLEESENRQAQLEGLLPGSYALQAAVDTAYWDLLAQQRRRPLYQVLGSDPQMVTTSYTIGISELDAIPEKIHEAKPYPILKIKLGTAYDHAIMRTIREHSDKMLRVDVNEGWGTLDQAKRGVEWLVQENVEFLEQPMPAGQLEDIAKLREFSPLPLVADENSVRPEDIPGLVGVYDGINIKLMKCGGLTNARKMITMGQERGFDIMLGCMVETSVGITAMASLGSRARWLDLDGNVLLAVDPFQGLTNQAGVLRLPERPGLGIQENP